ncbi:helix-turn-helix domain-containing protein [Halopenitus persicus]|uniref:Transcriptional regulator, XRE family n=1 Tax=Halopenitus persicus TaxID=1048396 RepID=A0A1H3DI94_9EURY|nr:multiprotein-bridging factor 1 family protein [Halopenitus persicus]QHS16264.1 multiprotein-bridging factor 1 family protein [haloarchaeon 3A1-DGR]SDX66136.1 transcriptional regulator, XRE family [Halopenitus persicus]
MAKYSTGSSSGGGDGDSCELCGRETGDLRRAKVAGATLLVCSNCRPHDDSADSSSGGGSGGSDRGDDSPSRSQELARKQAKMYDAGTGDASHWEQHGTDYEDDQLPYLVSGYGARAEQARQDAGLTIEELSEETGLAEDDILAVEQGRAARANVGGSVIRALEEHLDAALVDE